MHGFENWGISLDRPIARERKYLMDYNKQYYFIIWRWLMTNTENIDYHTQQPETSLSKQLVTCTCNTHFATLLLSLFSSREFFTVSSSSKMVTRAQSIP